MITISDINNSIKEMFNNSLTLNVSTVYEKDKNSDNYKLVIVLHKLYYEREEEKKIYKGNVLYTKLIFLVDPNKTYLVKNSFLYLYDINCIYHSVNFNDILDFQQKLSNRIENNDFGDNIKILSKFMEYPTTLVNEWLNINNIDIISVKSIKYSPKINIIPCKYLTFNFKMEINNVQIELKISKEGKNDFNYKFIYPNGVESVDKINLLDFVETVGFNLNKIFKK